MDLSVGTRVRITENICVEVGIFNGAMGTIKGIVYTKGEPPSQVNKHATYIYIVFFCFNNKICKPNIDFFAVSVADERSQIFLVNDGPGKRNTTCSGAVRW